MQLAASTLMAAPGTKFFPMARAKLGLPVGVMARVDEGCQDQHSWHSDPGVPIKHRYYIQTFGVGEVSTEEEPH